MISFEHASKLVRPAFSKIQARHREQLQRWGRPLSSLSIVETARQSDHWLFIYQSESLAGSEVVLHKNAGALFVTDWGLVGDLKRSGEPIYQGMPERLLDNPMYQVDEGGEGLFEEDA